MRLQTPGYWQQRISIIVEYLEFEQSLEEFDLGSNLILKI